MEPLRIRTYGTSGPPVGVLHGGPGAAGYMAPVARGLEDSFRVFEPLQRRSGGEPLTVARHVADLHELVESHCGAGRPALVGSSWGAMLTLAYAAAHPGSAGPLVLVGCGTFDRASRDQMRSTLDERLDESLRRQLGRLPKEFLDPDERFAMMGKLILPAYSYDLLTDDQEFEDVDAQGFEETWQDMIRLQAEGVYPAAFATIQSPVLMLHGAADPHPGRMVRTSLEPHLPQLEYHEWKRCGHYPWLERAVRDQFFAVVRGWLARHLEMEPRA